MVFRKEFNHVRAFTGTQHPRNPLFLSLLLPHPRAPCSGATQRTAALSQLPAEPPRAEAPARTKNEARGPRRGDSRGSAARRSPAAAPRPPTSPERAGRGLPAPLSPSTGPHRLTVAATRPPSAPTAAQRSPNGRRARYLRSPRAHLTEPLAPLPPAQRRLASRRTAPPPLTPLSCPAAPVLPRPRAAHAQGGGCAPARRRHVGAGGFVPGPGGWRGRCWGRGAAAVGAGTG